MTAGTKGIYVRRNSFLYPVKFNLSIYLSKCVLRIAIYFQGYPGDMVVFAKYKLSPNSGSLNIEFTASSTKKTPVNLANHMYFNLAGHETGTCMQQKYDEVVPRYNINCFRRQI